MNLEVEIVKLLCFESPKWKFSYMIIFISCRRYLLPWRRKALDAHYNLVDGIHSKIFSLLSSIALMKKSVENIERRLDSPDCKKNILLVTHQILKANLYAKKMLRRESENLEHAIDSLKNDIVAQAISDNSPKNIFKTREVYDLIRRQFFRLEERIRTNSWPQI